MKVQAIVETAFQTGVLTLEQDRQLTILVQQSVCLKDWGAVDALLEAILNGQIHPESEKDGWEVQAA